MVAGPALQARTRKGDKLLAQSRAAEIRKDWDTALSFAEQALSEDPADVAYQLSSTRLRFYAGQYHIDEGKRLRNQGQLEQALTEFQKAYGINPASAMAEEETARTKAMIEREKNKPVSQQNPEERAMTPAQFEKQREDKKFAAMLPLPELKPLNPAPINLKMSNQPPKVLFETVGKLAGVNVLFDPEYTSGGTTPKAQSIELNNATLDEALDYLSLVTKSFWKPISANAIFVTQDNQTKRREFEDYVVKVFYLSNVMTAQEMQEIVTALRTVAEIQKIFTYQAQNAIIIRAEADKVALAEKMVADLDKPRGEVLVDVLVMTVNRTRERDLAAAVATSGINSPISFTPRSSISSSVPATTPAGGSTTPAASASTSIPLSNIARISTRDFSLTLPGGLLNALLTDANTKVLQAPQVRAVDRQKVSMKIGDRVPYATGSFQPGIGGVGINPLVNTQFTFLDTGVNVDITPFVHGNDEVSLHVEIDISNVAQFLNLGGVQEPEVAQTKIINDVRLKQGEVNLMGGLMQVEEDKTISGVPGLGNIPVLRRLFTSETTTKKESELVIALIPHIVRSTDITDVNLRGIAAGNGTVVKLNYAPQKPDEAPQPQAPAQVVPQPVPGPAPTAAPATAPGPVIPGVNAPPIVGAPNAEPPQPLVPPATAPPVPPVSPEARQAQTPAGTATVKFVPAQANGELNQTVTVSLMVENARDLASTPMQIRFDPKVLRLNDVVRGNLLASDGQQVTFSKNVLNDSGEATVNISRLPSTGGVSGSGSIITLVFQAVGRGDTVVTVPQLTLRDSQAQPILTATPQLAVSVK
ncbi:MAG TPA: cohesin domain-containing protein [Bryobacteraceae bacterium]|nr:cohesin domain-containing protein [Bryobacteraceae bacterium]